MELMPLIIPLYSFRRFLSALTNGYIPEVAVHHLVLHYCLLRLVMVDRSHHNHHSLHCSLLRSPCLTKMGIMNCTYDVNYYMGNKESNVKGSESMRSSEQMNSSRMMMSSKVMRSASKQNKNDRFSQENTEIEKLLQLAGTFYMIGNQFRTYNLLSPYDGKLQMNSQDFQKVTTQYLIDIREEISQQRRKTRRPFEYDMNVTMELDMMISSRSSRVQEQEEVMKPPVIVKNESRDFKKKTSVKQEQPKKNQEYVGKKPANQPEVRDFHKKKSNQQPQIAQLGKKISVKDDRKKVSQEAEIKKKKSIDQQYKKKSSIPKQVDSDASNDKISRNVTPRSQVSSILHNSDEIMQKSGGSLDGNATSHHATARKPPQIHMRQSNDLTQSQNINLDRVRQALQADSPRSQKQSVKHQSNNLQEFQPYVDDDQVPNLRTSRRLLQMSMSNITEKTEQQFQEDDEKLTQITSPAVIMRKQPSRKVVMEAQQPRSPRRPQITVSPPSNKPSPKQERTEPKKTITAINVRPIVPPIEIGKAKYIRQPSRTPSSSRPNTQQRHLDNMSRLQKQITEAENVFYELLDQQIDFESIFEKYQIKQPTLPPTKPFKYTMGTVLDV